MALGIRAEGEASDVNNTLYRVRIYEEGYSGTIYPLEFSQEFLVISYEPSTDDITAPIIPSNVEVRFFDTDGDGLTLLSEILTKQQADYYLTIEQELAGGSYQPYWKGVILQDQIEFIEQSEPTEILIRAIDGISLLEARDFVGDNNYQIGVVGCSSLVEILIKCLNYGLPSELWGSKEDYLITNINWWADGQTYNVLQDPLNTLMLDEETFTTVIDKFNFSLFEYKTAFEVLEIIAAAFLGRVYMAGGSYIIEQISERQDALVKRVVYYSDGTQAKITGKRDFDQGLDETINSARFEDNVYTQFPALKEVTVEQNTFNRNLTTSLALAAAIPSGTVTRNFGVYNQFAPAAAPLTISQQLSLDLSFTVDFNIDVLPSFHNDPVGTLNRTNVYAQAAVDVEIRLEDANSADIYYYNGVSWRLNTPSSAIVGTGPIRTTVPLPIPNPINTNFNASNRTANITTANLPVTGRVFVTLKDFQIEVAVASYPFSYIVLNTSSITNFTGAVFVTNFETTYNNGETTLFSQVANNNSGINDNEVVDLGNIVLGTGGIQTGNIMVDPTGARTSITEAISWDYANETADLAFGNLIAKERLALQDRVLELYDGDIQMPRGYDWTVSFEGKRFLPLDYKFNAFQATVSGRYFIVNRFTSNIVITPTGTVLTPRIPINIGPSFKNTINEVSTINGVALSPQGFGTFKVNESGTTEANTPVTFTQGQRATYVSIDASDGGAKTLNIRESVIHLTWTGESGTYAITLPDGADIDGGVIEIILDGTFGAGKDVIISVTTGSIRGSETLTLNTANSKTTLRAIGFDYF